MLLPSYVHVCTSNLANNIVALETPLSRVPFISQWVSKRFVLHEWGIRFPGINACIYTSIKTPLSLAFPADTSSRHPLPALLLLNNPPNPRLQTLQPHNLLLLPLLHHPHCPTSTNQQRQFPPHEPQTYVPSCEDESYEDEDADVGQDPHQDADGDEGEGEDGEADDDGVEVELPREGGYEGEGGEGVVLEGGGEVVHC